MSLPGWQKHSIMVGLNEDAKQRIFRYIHLHIHDGYSEGDSSLHMEDHKCINEASRPS
jgi:hypothetical protein